ncbi:hypothetical protein GH714_010773 [Hevea brasiliensis]|uniref:Uncharacterized protein n=1 Tax=Hevea brasiliensis TaxID=3981 RepID=A0A6A6M9M8_HEVBR|nr:hypothetical protein GH714_010773 [Hevea brasiliensis]
MLRMGISGLSSSSLVMLKKPKLEQFDSIVPAGFLAHGNGFKTSAMRLGADVVVFLRCHDGKSQTQSIGLPSYTFFTTTGKEDIVVPMSPMASLKQQNREQSDIDHHVKDGDKRKLSSSSLVMLKKQKLEQFDSIVPAGFLARIRTVPESSPGPLVVVVNNNKESSNQIVKAPFVRSCK